MVRRKGNVDVKAVETLSENVARWARYQSLAGEHDNVETSPVRGTYDWRGYLEEETAAARKRADERKPAKKPERAAPTTAPSVFYA